MKLLNVLITLRVFVPGIKFIIMGSMLTVIYDNFHKKMNKKSFILFSKAD